MRNNSTEKLQKECIILLSSSIPGAENVLKALVTKIYLQANYKCENLIVPYCNPEEYIRSVIKQ